MESLLLQEYVLQAQQSSTAHEAAEWFDLIATCLSRIADAIDHMTATLHRMPEK